MILRRFISNSSIILKKNLHNEPILPKKILKDKSTSLVSLNKLKSILNVNVNSNQFLKSQFFIDYKMSTVKAGTGGDGLVSFLHLK